MIRELLVVRRAHQKDQPRELVLTLANGGNLALVAGEHQRAVEWLEEARQLADASLQDSDMVILGVLQNLAMAYVRTDKLPDALGLYQELLVRDRERLGPDHRYTLVTVNGYAAALSKDKQFERALAELSRAYETSRNKYGDSDEVTMALSHSLAFVHLQAGHADQAIELGQSAWESRKRRLGESHPNTLASLNVLAGGYRDAGNLQKAAELFQQCLKLQKETLGEDHPETASTKTQLARLQGNPDPSSERP
jgi:tetratricopeptide (TPR) repeat protein